MNRLRINDGFEITGKDSKKNEKANMIREIQNMLTEGISGRKIAATMHISRDSVRKYATGNPEYLAEKGNHAFIGLMPFQGEIISLIKQGYTRKDVCRKMSLIGYDGKLTQFYEYCRSLEEKGFIPSPVQLKRNQLFDLGRNKKYRYLTRSFLFRFLWSKQGEVSERDWEILCTRYPILETVQTSVIYSITGADMIWKHFWKNIRKAHSSRFVHLPKA